MTTIRCSSLPRILKCPASLVVPDVLIDSDSEAGNVGSAVHAALACAVLNQPVDLAKIAKAHDCEAQAIAPLYWIGKRVIDEFSQAFDTRCVEEELKAVILPGVTLSGHADWLGTAIEACGLTGVILDWKSGSQLSGHRDQLVGYAYLLGQELPALKGFKVVTAWLRDQETEVHDIDLDEVAALPDRIADAIDHPERFSPSYETCAWCPRRAECPALNAQLRETAAFLDADAEPSFEQMANEYPRLKLMEGAIARMISIIKERLKLNGSVVLADGRTLQLITQERDKILAPKALPVLVERYGLPAVADAVTVSKTAVCNVAKAGAGRGQKGKAADALLTELREIGAIEKNPVEIISLKEV